MNLFFLVNKYFEFQIQKLLNLESADLTGLLDHCEKTIVPLAREIELHLSFNLMANIGA